MYYKPILPANVPIGKIHRLINPLQSTSEQAKLGDGITVREAYDILGLEPGATKDDVTQAHRSLMMQFHPDKGGSNYLAS